MDQKCTEVYKSHKGNKHIILYYVLSIRNRLGLTNVWRMYGTISWVCTYSWISLWRRKHIHVSQVCYAIPAEGSSMASFSYKCHHLKTCHKTMSLSCWGASLARKWSWCFNGIVVVHGVCGRVASARISCFRASSGLARHRYWPNQSLTFLYEPLWEESQSIPLPNVWNACCGRLPRCQPGLKRLVEQ